jgi:hypothetical protein
MNQRTVEKLSELKSFPWFVNVGKAVGGDYSVIRNWKEAVESSAAEVWSSVQHQIKNEIADEVTKRDYKRSEEWNVIAAELRKEIAAIMTSSVVPLEKAFHLKSDFRGAVSWDMLGICIETEFSDLVRPMFFVPRLQPVYAAGHFPCGWEGPMLEDGWDGELPNARLIVY